MRSVILLICLASTVFAARVQYDDSVSSQFYPRKTADDIRRAQGLPEFAPLDPDVNRTFVQIVEAKGYPCEYHEANTTDGYILGLFRLPYGRASTKRGGPAVFLMHGFSDSGFTWIVNMPNEALPYVLADAGYDVWIGNVRGSRYSMKHQRLNPSQEAFWRYSWDEHALIDLPTMINYVLSTTGKKSLGYIGHSQGCATMFALATHFPSFVKKINNFVALAPVVNTAGVSVPFLRGLATLHLDDFIGLFGDRAFLPSPPLIVRFLGASFCNEFPLACESVIELLVGQHQGSLNNSRISVVIANYPGGTSVQNVRHWAQMIRTNLFRMYSFGSKDKNMQHYNQTEPPAYPISQYPTTLPTAIIYGGTDKLANKNDVEQLIQQLPAKPVIVKFLPPYAHMDFPWGLNAIPDFGSEVLTMMKKYNS